MVAQKRGRLRLRGPLLQEQSSHWEVRVFATNLTPNPSSIAASRQALIASFAHSTPPECTQASQTTCHHPPPTAARTGEHPTCHRRRQWLREARHEHDAKPSPTRKVKRPQRLQRPAIFRKLQREQGCALVWLQPVGSRRSKKLSQGHDPTTKACQMMV